MLFAATIILTELPRDARRNFQLLGNGSVGVNDHENHEREQEHDSAADGDAVEVLLSMMLVPVWVEYMELAIMSEMPVPLPECMRMKMIRPTPDRTSRTKKTITRGFNVSRFLYIYSVLRTQVD